ncbi:MAG TPA: UDP-N-acetylmuramoyl-L-alanine--D-glutamate ligase [bacterium]|nr:UDP-N-acetylmuramoyl-L-alanine--D-glutamate ligase [bacterium]
MELAGKRVVVVGLAGSGVAAIKYLARKRAVIAATDVKSAAELGGPLAEIASLKVELALSGHPEKIFADADLVVVSPGVRRDLPQLRKAMERGVPVLSELELAARELSAPMIAVTGTNGKSTVVSLTGEIMKEALGKDRVFVGGNLGTPLTEALEMPGPLAAAVVEVSSFQLEFADSFHPRVAVMLNITSDHLDRYRDFDDYAATKWRIFANQAADDFAVINIDDPVTARKAAGLRQRVMTTSLIKEPEHGMWLAGEVLEHRSPEGRERLAVKDVPLHGRHNLQNVMACYCAARAMGAGPEAVRAAIRRFQGLHHRMELVREWRGVRYYNDSKATNAAAVEAAVSGLERPVVLLMGGQAKGCSFTELAGRIKGRVKRVVAFGECGDQVVREMSDQLPVEGAADLGEALDVAGKAAAAGDAVLLAPACASFDQFKNYKDRGDTFRRLVMEIK